MDISILIISIILIFLIIELLTFYIVRFVNKKFQWLIISKDKEPHLSKMGLEKFFTHGYDSELGWIRKPNTYHDENGKYGKTRWNINDYGARVNPNFDSKISSIEVVYGPNRVGDIPHSHASVDKAKQRLNYNPQFTLQQGLKEAVKWYWENL